MAIDLEIAIALRPTDDGRATLTLAATGATDSPIVLDVGRRRGGAWIDYVAGTAWEMTRRRAAGRGASGACS